MPPPTAAEIAGLQADLASGSDDRLRPIVGATPGQALSADLATKLKALDIHFDPASAKPIGGGAAWEEQATDGTGGHWQVGLVRGQDGKMEIAYAERAQR